MDSMGTETFVLKVSFYNVNFVEVKIYLQYLTASLDFPEFLCLYSNKFHDNLRFPWPVWTLEYYVNLHCLRLNDTRKAAREFFHLPDPQVWQRSGSHSLTARKHGHCFVLHCALQRHPGKRFWPEDKGG